MEKWYIAIMQAIIASQTVLTHRVVSPMPEVMVYIAHFESAVVISSKDTLVLREESSKLCCVMAHKG